MSLLNFLISKSIMHIPGPLVGIFAKSYIAGPELKDAVRVTKELNSQGIMTTIDILGEFIKNLDEAEYYRERCIEILDTIKKEGLDANLSLKPTQMGLNLNKEVAFDNILKIVDHAKQLGNFVRIDMEDVTCTDDTIDFYRRLRGNYHGHVGVVLQAYLRRTPKDVENLSDGPMNFRLCKGIYNEKRVHAYKDPYIINQSFIYILEKMFQKGAYVGIATHDEKLIFEATRLIEKYGLTRDKYEFQMLLGVDEELRRIIVNSGHRLRVYVPFGKDWLPYSRRRLKENPNIARHALRQLFGIHGNN
ncbi:MULTISPECIES: proline dehydrogenase family protein [Calditerrivibrio]|uniref:proline dehydrogenase n=1 Tax=Calditerrivibrio nitroreducens TaxID=477976 RepID=A0A2J6WMP8_9BACT|nr:MAG: proline dehydrogenase [Calditerrivibrio nitroreducens]